MFYFAAHRRGVDVHALAEPTKLEALRKEYQERKETFKSQMQQSVLQKYGGEEYLQAPPKELLLAQTENYVEYNRKGQVVRGEEKAKVI